MSERCEWTSKLRCEWPSTIRVDFLVFLPTVGCAGCKNKIRGQKNEKNDHWSFLSPNALTKLRLKAKSTFQPTWRVRSKDFRMEGGVGYEIRIHHWKTTTSTPWDVCRSTCVLKARDDFIEYIYNKFVCTWKFFRCYACIGCVCACVRTAGWQEWVSTRLVTLDILAHITSCSLTCKPFALLSYKKGTISSY